MRLFTFVACALLVPRLALCRTEPAETDRGVTNAVAQPNDSVVLFEALCKALRDNYPMLELAGWEDSWVDEFRQKVQSAPSREVALQFMDELVCRLNDYHTRLFWPGKPQLSGPPVRVEPVLAQTNLPPGYGIWGLVHPPVDMLALAEVAIAVAQAEKSSGL